MPPVRLIGALLATLSGYSNAAGGAGGTGDKQPQRADYLQSYPQDSIDLSAERRLPLDSD